MSMLKFIHNKSLISFTKKKFGLQCKNLRAVSSNPYQLNIYNHSLTNSLAKYFSSSSSLIANLDFDMGLSVKNNQYIDQDENIEKIFNPDKPATKKFLRDVYVNEKIKIKELAAIFKCASEELLTSVAQFRSSPSLNDYLGMEEVRLLAYEYDCVVVDHSKKDISKMPLRPPVVTIMGHVDHGKTTLLDAFRNSNIAEGEFGGITQKIGSFSVKTKEGKALTFIDTPGHEAFTNMRRRGAQCTDIVILVVSCIDGCQPQTFEAINHAKNAGVPLIVAVNKIDRGADPLEVEQELYNHGLQLESFGGNIPVIHISAKFKKNIDLLEELILFQAELMELKMDSNGLAEGFVLEVKKTSDGEGKACTVIVQKGTLKDGDTVVIGDNYGKIRSMKNDWGNYLKEAYPSMAVEISGLKHLPESGDPLFVVENENIAKLIIQRRNAKKAREQSVEKEEVITGSKIKFSTSRERRKYYSGKTEVVKEKLEEISNILREKLEKTQDEDEIKKVEEEIESHERYVQQMIDPNNFPDMINIVVKAQDKGTLETLLDQINKSAGNSTKPVNIVSASVGSVTETDIREARRYHGTILGMDIPYSAETAKMAKTEGVEIKIHKIIYSILDEIKALVEGEDGQGTIVIKGQGTIKEIFEVKLNKMDKRKVAGLSVSKGLLSKDAKFRILRGGKLLAKNLELSSLKFHKIEVPEIKHGQECGLSFFQFTDFQKGDQIEAYEIKSK